MAVPVDDETELCPICGAPNHACRSTEATDLAFEGWRDDVEKLNSRDPANGPVYVRERVIDSAQQPNSKRRTSFVRYSPGDHISIEEAVRLGVPLVDVNGNPVAAPQRRKRDVETQDVKPPRKPRSRRVETK